MSSDGFVERLKSKITGSPSWVMRIFDGLMSQCRICRAWANCNPRQTPFPMSMTDCTCLSDFSRDALEALNRAWIHSDAVARPRYGMQSAERLLAWSAVIE